MVRKEKRNLSFPWKPSFKRRYVSLLLYSGCLATTVKDALVSVQADSTGSLKEGAHMKAAEPRTAREENFSVLGVRSKCQIGNCFVTM